jgi:hypothetical protein
LPSLPITNLDPGRLSRWIPSEVQSASGDRIFRTAGLCRPRPRHREARLGHAHCSREPCRRTAGVKRLAAHANRARAVGARMTAGELFDLWVARGRTGWSLTRLRNLGSIIERHLEPELCDHLVGDLASISSTNTCAPRDVPTASCWLPATRCRFQVVTAEIDLSRPRSSASCFAGCGLAK